MSSAPVGLLRMKISLSIVSVISCELRRLTRACYSAGGYELLQQLLRLHSVSSSRKERKTSCPSNKEQDYLSFGTLRNCNEDD